MKNIRNNIKMSKRYEKPVHKNVKYKYLSHMWRAIIPAINNFKKLN